MGADMHRIIKELFNKKDFVMVQTYEEQLERAWEGMLNAYNMRDISEAGRWMRKLFWLRSRLTIQYQDEGDKRSRKKSK